MLLFDPLLRGIWAGGGGNGPLETLKRIVGFDLTFQKRFVSFSNKNNCKTDLKFCASWLTDEENTSDLHLVLDSFYE